MWGSKKYYVDKVGQLYKFAIVLFFFFLLPIQSINYFKIIYNIHLYKIGTSMFLFQINLVIKINYR